MAIYGGSAIGNITGLGTGAATALGVNTGSAGAFVIFGGAGSFTTLSATGQTVSSFASALSTPAHTLTGAWINTGGTATTTKPHFLIEPTGTTSTSWSTTGTGLGVNAASGFVGNLEIMPLTHRQLGKDIKPR